MRTALVCDLLEAPDCGMREALESFLQDVRELGRQDELLLLLENTSTTPWQDFPLLHIPYLADPRRRLLWSQLLIPKYLQQADISSVWHPYQVGPPLFTHTRRVVSVWDLAPLSYSSHKWKGKRTWRTFLYYRLILRWALKRADTVVVHSKAIARETQRVYSIPENRITVIYPTLAPRFRQEAMTQRNNRMAENSILYVGSSDPRKNLPLLLEAFCLLCREGTGHRLVMRTDLDDAQQDQMNMLLDRYGVRRELVTIKPRLDATSLASLYDEASVFAFPSLYEGFGLPVIEALCHGLPVAALPVSTLPEILGDAGYPSRGSTPAEFADAIKRALTSVDDASKAAETALRSKQRALALDAISPVAQTLDLLKRL